MFELKTNPCCVPYVPKNPSSQENQSEVVFTWHIKTENKTHKVRLLFVPSNGTANIFQLQHKGNREDPFGSEYYANCETEDLFNWLIKRCIVIPDKKTTGLVQSFFWDESSKEENPEEVICKRGGDKYSAIVRRKHSKVFTGIFLKIFNPKTHTLKYLPMKVKRTFLYDIPSMIPDGWRKKGKLFYKPPKNFKCFDFLRTHPDRYTVFDAKQKRNGEVCVYLRPSSISLFDPNVTLSPKYWATTLIDNGSRGMDPSTWAGHTSLLVEGLNPQGQYLLKRAHFRQNPQSLEFGIVQFDDWMQSLRGLKAIRSTGTTESIPASVAERMIARFKTEMELFSQKECIRFDIRGRTHASRKPKLITTFTSKSDAITFCKGSDLFTTGQLCIAEADDEYRIYQLADSCSTWATTRLDMYDIKIDHPNVAKEPVSPLHLTKHGIVRIWLINRLIPNGKEVGEQLTRLSQDRNAIDFNNVRVVAKAMTKLQGDADKQPTPPRGTSSPPQSDQ